MLDRDVGLRTTHLLDLPNACRRFAGDPGGHGIDVSELY